MRTLDFHLNTVKETPADAEIASHKLMIRAGMIRKLTSGIYNWTPLGLRVLRKVEAIVREEMNKAGALEMLMPAVQPKELWEETGRWEKFGNQLLKMTDRQGREYAFGPTHEEVITAFARAEIKSYKQLPITFYQIQTKFRDEIRPRFGVMRAREFLMKDAYSFHLDNDSLVDTYHKMYAAYENIFNRLGLKFRAVEADTGAIGGSGSHEFHVLADSGEDGLAVSNQGSYAANVELAEAVASSQQRPEPSAELQKIETKNQKSIADVCSYLDVDASTIVKTLIIENQHGDLFAICLRGDHELNPIKVSKLPEFEFVEPVMASDEKIVSQLGVAPGSIGPVNLNIPVIVDRSAAVLADFVCGANEDDFHLSGVNWDRDAQISSISDVRNVVAGDPSPDGKGELEIVRGIEVGHVFQLGTQYAKAMNAVVLNQNGQSQVLSMGCYGIGVSRIVASAIEQNHDDRGIVWPGNMAPFQIALIPVNAHKSERLRKAADELYSQLNEAGYEVIYDNRKARPGFMFADMELIGIPHRIVMSDRGLDNETLEYKGRQDADNTIIRISETLEFLAQKIN
ncbi:MAG: proline--tRNA ligase [bacterium]